MAGPGLDASPTRMPKKLICQRITIIAIVAPSLGKCTIRNLRTTRGNGQRRTQTEKTPKTDPGKRCGDCKRKLTQGDHGWRRPQGYEHLSGSLNVVPHSANAAPRWKSHCEGEHYTDGRPNAGLLLGIRSRTERNRKNIFQWEWNVRPELERALKARAKRRLFAPRRDAAWEPIPRMRLCLERLHLQNIEWGHNWFDQGAMQISLEGKRRPQKNGPEKPNEAPKRSKKHADPTTKTNQKGVQNRNRKIWKKASGLAWEKRSWSGRRLRKDRRLWEQRIAV